MKRLLAIFAILALAAASRRTIEEHAAKGDWRAVITDAFDLAATNRTEAAAALYDVTIKYLPETDERRANNLDDATALLKIAIQNDKHDVRALTLLSTIESELPLL